MIASAGLALGVLVVALLGAAAFIASEQAAAERSRLEQSRRIAALDAIALSLEAHLESQDQSRLRQTLIRGVQKTGIERVRAMTGDGMIVADSNPAGITLQPIPDRLPPIDQWPHGMVTEVQAPGVGSLLLLADAPDTNAPTPILMRPGVAIGGIGAVALLTLLLIYRITRRRIMGASVISEALTLVDAGEDDDEALRVDESLSPAARAWNRVLDERKEFQRKLRNVSIHTEDVGRAHELGGAALAADALWLGVVLLDEGARVRYANGASGVLLGVEDVEISRQIDEIVSDQDVGEAAEELRSGLLRSRRNVEITRDGGSVLKLSFRPVRRSDGAAAVLVVEDITQQRTADDANHAFIAQAAHELRTPLTNIRLYAEEAMELGPDDHTQRSKCVNVINGESRRLERVVDDMLSAAEMRSGSLTLRRGDVRLEQLFEDLANDLESAGKPKSIRVSFDLPPKLPVIDADREKLSMSVHNLVGNAIKYTPKGGSVSVAVREEDGVLKIDVADTGIGIKPEETERIFEQFYRSDDERATEQVGTGLGLTLARQIARMHGGDLTVESEIDKGSTFTFTVPVTTPQDRKAA